MKNPFAEQQNSSLLNQIITPIEEYGIFTLSPEGIVLYWNDGAQSIQGYSAEEILNKPFAELYEKEVHKPQGYFKEIIQKAREQGRFEEEGWRQHKKGTYYWSTMLITPIYDETHALIAYTVISRDLTKRKLAAELSEISQASLEHHTSVLAVSSILWERSKDGQFISPHLQWEHFTGQPWPEYQAFGWLEMYPPEEHVKIKAFWQKLSSLSLESIKNNWEALQDPDVNKVLILETRLWSKIHQEYRYVTLTVVPQFGENKIMGWLGNEKDVHKQAVITHQLKEAFDDQRVIVNSARLGLWRWHLHNHQITFDKNVAVYLGLQQENRELTFTQLMACIHPDDKEVIQHTLQHCQETGNQFNTEFRVIWPDRSIHYIAGIGEMQHDEQNQPTQMVGSYWDITERKQFENERMQALQRAEENERHRAQAAETYKQKLEEFIDTITHEVRNPLNGIYSAVTFLKDTLSQLEEVMQEGSGQLMPVTAQKFHSALTALNEQIVTVDKCAKQQKLIVDDVLDLSKLESGKIELNPQPFRLKTLIKDIKQMFSSKIAEKKLTVALDIPKEEDFLIVDSQRLSQIIINLLSNAIKFTPSAGKINIVGVIEPIPATDEVLLHIAVKDSGIGMTEEEKQRLFDRFSQANRQTASEYGGSGLGLVISQKLVKRMGGTIHVNSKKWHGTEFRFAVRCEKLTQQQYLALQQTTPHHFLVTFPHEVSRKLVLVVDDDPMNQKILQRYIEKAGHACQIAANGLEALNKLEQTKFDLIFMDTEMPVMNGLEAAREIRKREKRLLTSQIPIIGISGNVRKEQQAIALNAGMDECIAKPYERDEIYKAIARFIAPQQQLSQLHVLPQESVVSPAFFAPSPSSKQEGTKNVSIFKRQESEKPLADDNNPKAAKLNP